MSIHAKAEVKRAHGYGRRCAVNELLTIGQFALEPTIEIGDRTGRFELFALEPTAQKASFMGEYLEADLLSKPPQTPLPVAVCCELAKRGWSKLRTTGTR